MDSACRGNRVAPGRSLVILIWIDHLDCRWCAAVKSLILPVTPQGADTQLIYQFCQ